MDLKLSYKGIFQHSERSEESDFYENIGLTDFSLRSK